MALLLVAGYSNTAERTGPADGWRSARKAEVERILEINRKQTAWDQDAVDVTNGTGLLALAGVLFGLLVLVAILPGYVPKLAGANADVPPEWLKRLRILLVMNFLLMVLPFWFTGTRSVLKNGKLVNKVRLLLGVAEDFARLGRADEVFEFQLQTVPTTEGAAQLLSYNYRLLGTWPLALTAYNHGAAGMRRAVEATGTNDFVRINRNYKSPTFGFASRNFYPSFLAALAIDQNPEKYFGPIERAPEAKFSEVAMPAYVPVKVIERSLAVDRATLRTLNPALLPTVWNGERLVPRGYRLRLPGSASLTSEQLAQRLPPAEQYVAQIESRSHRVRRGESLAGLAERYGLPVRELAAMNGLQANATLRTGRRLRLPDRMPGRVAGTVASATPAVVASASANPPTGAVRAVSASAQPQAVAGAADAPRVHVVTRGDSLSAIAARSGVPEAELMRINGLRNPNYIFEGQRLTLVASAGAAAAPEAETATQAVRESREDEAAAAAVARMASRAEPVSAGEAEALGPALVAGAESTPASTDAVDYGVAGDHTIRVLAAETLGHYADWLGVSASRLRQLNKLRGGQPVLVGRKLKLDLGKSSAAEFEKKRREYHYALQANYFDTHRILGTEVYIVRRGDSLWSISQRYVGVPTWLLQQYNPDADLGDLRPGAQIVVPKIEDVPAADS